MLKGWGMELVSEETISILKARITTESRLTPQPSAAKAKKPLWKRILGEFWDTVNDE